MFSLPDGNDREGQTMKMVRVEWLDSAFARNPGWHDCDSTVSPVHIVTVGMIHEQTAEKIVIVSDFDSEGRVAGMQVIPMSAVTSITKLRRKNGRH